ncbi:cytochrome b/b6 domain-containing protein [Streptomyces ziwulingensis]|uniref:Ferric reductase-like transmembrane domain-containing protein n=1 Tax=Streptomyces ziwulingensis TaxID=1045501 RepID=A0ABP9BXL4_9ACTN
MNPPLATTADDSFASFLDFGAGVLSLVCLSASVIWGLVAQDRFLLVARQRILAQAVHRSTAVASLVLLLIHVGVKLGLAHTTWVAALVPFGLLATEDEQFGGRAVLIGFGTLAGLLMVFVAVTGALRNRFASPAPVAARWRAMHMLAYPAWCLALLHGLYAGRAAKPVFMLLYGLSLVAVMAALALRSAPAQVKRRIADRVTTLFGTDTGRAEREGREEREEREEAQPSGSRARAGSARPSSDRASRADSGVPQQRSYAPQTQDVPGTPGPPYDSYSSYSSYASYVPPPYEPGGGPAPQEPANGFAAAYRAVAGPPRARQPFASTGPGLPPDPRAARTMPYADAAAPGSWPVPSPPPVGEAPPSAYDPLTDTGHTIPVQGVPGTFGPGPSDLYDTGETNGVRGPYYPGDPYDSGPATGTTPGASYDFGAPGSGEPWNTPSGGSE